jgi:hypothetical protein
MSVIGQWTREMASQLVESRKHEIYILRGRSVRLRVKGLKEGRVHFRREWGVDSSGTQLSSDCGANLAPLQHPVSLCLLYIVDF